jgi:hypothetical protein
MIYPGIISQRFKDEEENPRLLFVTLYRGAKAQSQWLELPEYAGPSLSQLVTNDGFSFDHDRLHQIASLDTATGLLTRAFLRDLTVCENEEASKRLHKAYQLALTYIETGKR